MKDLKDTLNEQLDPINEGTIKCIENGKLQKYNAGRTEVITIVNLGADNLYTICDDGKYGDLDVVATKDIHTYVIDVLNVLEYEADKIASLKPMESWKGRDGTTYTRVK